MTEKSREKGDDAEDYPKVMQAVRDFIFEKHRFPQVRDIENATGIGWVRCNEVVDQLVRQKELYEVFGGKGKRVPRVIILYDMMQGVLMTQKKPDWLPNHGFTQKADISKRIEELQKEAVRYDQFERLLYATDITLEEAIAYTLDWLGFQNVVHHKDDKNNPDITFEYEGVKALLEAEGTTKAGKKDKIGQLNLWVDKELSQGGQAAKLRGFFAINHFIDQEPTKREEPLTSHAKEFLHYQPNFRYFTTMFLFDIAKRVVEGSLSKDDARKQIWEGEKIA